MQLTEKQKQGIKIGAARYKNKANFTAIAGFAGTGKAQPLNTVIPTPTSLVALGDIKVGDEVLDRYGKPTRVTGVFPQGELPSWEVLLTDGRRTRCNIEHLWSVKDSQERERVVTTGDIIQEGVLNIFNKPNFYIPMNGMVEYDDKNHKKIKDEMPAYNIGMFGFIALMRTHTSQAGMISPHIRFGSTKKRIDYLRGFYAADKTSGSDLEVSSRNILMLHDLQSLVHSLGYPASVELEPTVPGLATLRMSIPNLNTWVPIEQEWVGIKSIAPLTVSEEMVCISVDNKEQLYLTDGYIVTHNTTLVTNLVEELGVIRNRIAYAAYTGKAGLVLRQQGHNAITLHKLLYNSIHLSHNKYIHRPKPELDRDLDLIVVDEVSMVPRHMWELLIGHGVHVIALGDPFQLQPVAGSAVEVLDTPHIFLDEIMRQSLESEIIRLSQHIRQGGSLDLCKGKDVQVISQSELVLGMYEWADQILVGRNDTRRHINNQFRQYVKEIEGDPQIGDKMICLRNYWEEGNIEGDPLVNGMIGHLVSAKGDSSNTDLFKKLKASFIPEHVKAKTKEELQNNVYWDLSLDYKLITEGVSSYEDFVPGATKDNPLFQFDYGYAITTHKSQGSQWGNVLLFEEVLSRPFHPRWLYTAATRAVNKLVIVKK